MELLARLSTSAVALLRRDPRVSAAVAGTALAVLGAVVLGRIQRARAFSSGTSVVSGASSGIGAAVAKLLAARGSHVVLLARSAAPLAALAAEISAAGGSASWYAVDCADGAAVDAVAADVLAKHGAPSLVVCSAGAGQWKTLWEMRVEEIKQTLDAPLLAAAFVSRAFLPAMLTAPKSQPRGVVLVQSPAGSNPWAGATMYAACRGGLHTLADALRLDVAAVRGGAGDVRVTEVVCGEVASSYFETAGPRTRNRIPGIAILVQPVLSCPAAARAVWAGAVSGRDRFVAPLTLAAIDALAAAPVIGSALRALVAATAWTTTPAQVLAAQAAAR